MSERIATPVVKNKFWVVEEQGEKIATIQARDDGGIVYVHDDQREYFDTVSILKKKYNIKFGGYKPPKQKTSLKEVYGFPISGKSYNEIKRINVTTIKNIDSPKRMLFDPLSYSCRVHRNPPQIIGK